MCQDFEAGFVSTIHRGWSSCDLGTEFFSFFELQLKNAIWILLQSVSEFLRTYLCGADGYLIPTTILESSDRLRLKFKDFVKSDPGAALY